MTPGGREGGAAWHVPGSLKLAPPGPDQHGSAAVRVGDPISIANEFSEVRLSMVRTRNGARLLVEAPRSGQWVMLCPLELEALTWQGTATFSAMIGTPNSPLITEDGE